MGFRVQGEGFKLKGLGCGGCRVCGFGWILL